MDKISGGPNWAAQNNTRNNFSASSRSESSSSIQFSDSSDVRPNTCNLDIEKLAKELGFDPTFLASKINSVIAASDTLGAGTEPPAETPPSGPVM